MLGSRCNSGAAPPLSRALSPPLYATGKPGRPAGALSQETSARVARKLPRGRVRVFRSLRVCILLFSLACRASPPAAPGELVDDSGARTTLAAPPARVVSLIPATTELLFALGAGPRVVGRTTWCDYPAAAASVPDLGNG